MRPGTMRAFLIALVLLACGAGPADAATVSLATYEVDSTSKGGGTEILSNTSIEGTDAPERLRLEAVDGALSVASPNGAVAAGPGCTGVGEAVRCPTPSNGPGAIDARLGGGEDELVLDVSALGGVRIDGGPGDDRIDTSAAEAGATVLGGPGDDTILAGPRDDTVFPGEGSDTVDLGVPFNVDTVSYTDVTTPLSADVAAGTVASGAELDRLTGAYRLIGGQGDDVLIGGPGSDRLDGWTGSDRVLGGEGADTLESTTGPGETDVLDGGAGPDGLEGMGAGLRLAGGPGDDRLVIGTPFGFPQPVDCGPGADRLDLRSPVAVDGCELVRLDPGAVTVLPGSPDAAFRARVRLRCPPGYGHPCPATVELRLAQDMGGALLDRRRLTVRRSRPRAVAVALGPRGRRLLRGTRPAGMEVQVWVRMRARRSWEQLGVTVRLQAPAPSG